MAISQDNIDRVREACDIVEVVSSYVTLRRRGKNYFGLCPFHQEKTPSFSVNSEAQIFHCFGCGVGGNVFTFIMRMEGISFPEAVRTLADSAGITLPEENEDTERLRDKEALIFANKIADELFRETLADAVRGKVARAYLNGRGFTEESIEIFQIGYAPKSWDALLNRARQQSLSTEIVLRAGLAVKNESGRLYDRFRDRITFPIHNLNGQVVAFGARRLAEDGSPKYINSPETEIYQKRQMLYGLRQGRGEIRAKERVIVVEGYTDLIRLAMGGIRNTVATSGTALTEAHARLLRRYTSTATLLYDSDSAGASAALRGAEQLLASGLDVKICSLPRGQDPDQYVRENGPAALSEALARSPSLIDFKLAQFRNAANATEKARSTREIIGIVARIDDELQRTFLVRELAGSLEIEESLLWAEIDRLAKRPGAAARTAARITVPEKVESDFFKSRRGAAELGLVEVALGRRDLIPRLLDHVEAGELKHPEIRQLFASLMKVKVDGESADVRRLITSIREPVIARTVSQTLSSGKLKQNAWKYAVDCLLVVKCAGIDERITVLRERLRREPGSELLQEIRQLQQQRIELNRAEFGVENGP